MENQTKKTLGQAIDELIENLKGLDETSRPIAIKTVCEHLNISLTGISSIVDKISKQNSISQETPKETNETEKSSKTIDIRSLKEQKSPSSAIEMACILALYLNEYASSNERKEEIEAKDIMKYFKQADYPLPKVPEQVLRNAKGAGYFDSKTRGKFKLNPVGYNLATHALPRIKK
jgi:hypothetical protein